MQISNSNDLDLWSSIQFDFMVWGPALNSSSIDFNLKSELNQFDQSCLD